jgi:hypothetical protein
VSRYHFAGHPAFLDTAAAEIGRPEVAFAARRDPTLVAISTLCAQAVEGNAEHVAGILAEAESLSDRIRIALRASELMIVHVRSRRDSLHTVPDPSLTPARSSPSGRIPRRTT